VLISICPTKFSWEVFNRASLLPAQVSNAKCTAQTPTAAGKTILYQQLNIRNRKRKSSTLADYALTAGLDRAVTLHIHNKENHKSAPRSTVRQISPAAPGTSQPERLSPLIRSGPIRITAVCGCTSRQAVCLTLTA